MPFAPGEFFSRGAITKLIKMAGIPQKEYIWAVDRGTVSINKTSQMHHLPH